ncbi:hypothetical protein [Natronorubrum sulfidifaciens]|uniref:BppU N-terminal domain-containing protein n=1 Tax=Natronorubrum sulfidifaciens JCM 14089 TaxID=1230460 RepID=L9WCX7_9EURY|nr:hypothetical protein [Natronorubrum sulfidifaciens]ELY47319.1 hypothetical protein C495_03637 [Natronorubrum sulfidifaciens JCM 14089]
METFIIRQGDTAPAIRATLRDRSGVAIPLEDAFIEFRMRDRDGNLLIRDSAGTDPDEVGVVIYEWQPGDTDRAGVFRSEWQVTYPDGGIETFPNMGYLTVYVIDDVMRSDDE